MGEGIVQVLNVGHPMRVRSARSRPLALREGEVSRRSSRPPLGSRFRGNDVPESVPRSLCSRPFRGERGQGADPRYNLASFSERKGRGFAALCLVSEIDNIRA